MNIPPKAKIENISAVLLGNSVYEFTFHVQGPMVKAEVHYGDGAMETMPLDYPEENPTIHCEHRFQPGSYDVSFRVFDQDARVDNRRLYLHVP